MANGISSLSAKNTHDLWVESRKFQVGISRPTPTTIQLDISYPSDISVVDGAVIILKTIPLSYEDHPEDGRQYSGSTDFSTPVDYIQEPGSAQVIAFYSAALNAPLTGVADPITGRSSFQITVTNTVSNQLYYAGVYPSSNILQYYLFGVQSYPLEGSRIEKDSSTYTGNIPSFSTVPTAPTPSMVYYDTGLGVVQFWTGTTWIPTRSDAIMSGTYNPGTLGQTYFLTAGSILKVFDGTKWVTASAANFQVRNGATWLPLGNVSSGIKLPESPAAGDFFFDFTLGRAQYWDSASWIYPNSTNTLYVGGPTSPACINTIVAEPVEILPPYLGQLFYNTTQRVLNVWNGSTWVKANTDQPGTPSTDKIAIGTDGSYDERVRLIQIIKGELGWPTVCVELKEEHFNIAIDNALETYRQLCDHAYKMQYVLFTLLPDQQIYYMNDPVAGLDKVVNVSKIHRLNILGSNSLNWDSNIYFQTFLNQYYSAGYTDTLSIHLVHSLSEDFQRIFAGDVPFVWDEASRQMVIARRISRAEKVVLECTMERTEQELILDRYCKQFIQNFAIAECKMQLGMIRTKFSSGTPGAQGPINLNGELLVSEARQDLTELREQLLNYEFGGLVGKGNASFLCG